MRAEVGDGHLMRAPGAFNGLVINRLGTSPALWSAQHDHRPDRNAAALTRAPLALNRANFSDDRVERVRHFLMHRFGFMPLDEVRLVTVAREKLLQFRIRHAA